MAVQWVYIEVDWELDEWQDSEVQVLAGGL